MKRILMIYPILMLIAVVACKSPSSKTSDFFDYATSRKSDLQLGVYITAHTVQEQFSTEIGCREAISVLRCNGISIVYVEVYRPGMVVPTELLKNTVSLLEKNGFEVVGGIATLPGEGVGVAQQGPLTWFNWQNPKTQSDLKKIVEETTPLFKTFILDDFFCTADTSLESKTVKGDKSWSEYRRGMLTEIARSVFINPAKAKNPDITMIIKYPQWYDCFHQFGYDVATEPELFDKVYVGTETRGQYTQRYGFVQPYEGFINYRWISTLAGDKIGAAWFDHGDCNGTDFLEQAYQSVLAGAKELVIFNFGDYLTGHPGHHLLRQDFEKLADLAAAVAKNPVVGTVGYKPANSDAGADLYIMDYIGMFGVSLVPDSKYPENASVIFLPTQAATDSSIAEKVKKSLNEGKKVVMTTGFLARVKNGEKLAQLAGIQYPLFPEQVSTQIIQNEGKTDSLKFPLQTDFRIQLVDASVLLQTAGKNSTPFLVKNSSGNISVINIHTFSQADFDAVGEVLLCPRQLGLLEIPESWANVVRSVFQSEEIPELVAPSRVSFQQLGDGSFVINNYNQLKATVEIKTKDENEWTDAFSGKKLEKTGDKIIIEMQPRSRIWSISKR